MPRCAAAIGGSFARATSGDGIVEDATAACNVDPSVTCGSSDSRLYEEPDCDLKSVHCVDGKWQELPQTESSPTVVCPATLPTDGDACPALDCSSKDKTCNFGCQYAECDAFDAHWRVHTYDRADCRAVVGGSADARDGG